MSEQEKQSTSQKSVSSNPDATLAQGDQVANKGGEDTSTYPALGRWMMFVDNPKNVNKIVYGLCILCAGLFLADFLYHKHTYVAIEDIPGFYALYGFFMCAALVVCAKVMRIFLKRGEDYYAPYDVESEAYPEDGLDRESHNA